ncbi:BTB/POZ domain-containing protein 3-like [Contarinia nasturtii]|uniref:BTB/POZ domain-containing protein 3-like n=1 Tax=Contarinia nasturtii TaxID=265458 RepID=UPI0012D3ACEE|nr:BTB/POZ domain-containing protein 3-like [Contarinia nasturtii]XP_031636108.1 BTB/POZ domain-containing protein 3-like [Contarinia nasturtii]
MATKRRRRGEIEENDSDSKSETDDASEKDFRWDNGNELVMLYEIRAVSFRNDDSSDDEDGTYECQMNENACAKLYNDRETSDVEIFISSRPDSRPRKSTPGGWPCSLFYAHKSILASASQMFHDMFYGPTKKEGDIRIYNISPDPFEEFLRCFYMRNVSFKMGNIAGVMKLAKIFVAPDCMKTCVDFLNKCTLSPKNIFDLIELANEYEITELKQRCDECITSNKMEMIIQHDDFLYRDRYTLKKILQLNLLECDQKIIFDRCIAWANCKIDYDTRGGSGNAENKGQLLREALGDCIYLIRFNRMTIEDFKELAVKYEGLFTAAELIDITQSINVNGYESEFFRQ